MKRSLLLLLLLATPARAESGRPADYEKGTFSVNWFGGMYTSGINGTVNYVRVGKLVTLEVINPGGVTANVTNNYWATAAAVIPVALRPGNIVRTIGYTVNNGSTDGAPSYFVVNSSGQLEVDRIAGNWASGTANCGFQTWSATYIVP